MVRPNLKKIVIIILELSMLFIDVHSVEFFVLKILRLIVKNIS